MKDNMFLIMTAVFWLILWVDFMYALFIYEDAMHVYVPYLFALIFLPWYHAVGIMTVNLLLMIGCTREGSI